MPLVRDAADHDRVVGMNGEPDGVAELLEIRPTRIPDDRRILEWIEFENQQWVESPLSATSKRLERRFGKRSTSRQRSSCMASVLGAVT
jgi:hypothetical protein